MMKFISRDANIVQVGLRSPFRGRVKLFPMGCPGLGPEPESCLCLAAPRWHPTS